MTYSTINDDKTITGGGEGDPRWALQNHSAAWTCGVASRTE
jgi:hypothetical protein